MYQVVVDNVGVVHEGKNPVRAVQAYSEYVSLSKCGTGRAGGENVTILKGETIYREFDYCTWLNSEYDSGLRRTYGF